MRIRWIGNLVLVWLAGTVLPLHAQDQPALEESLPESIGVGIVNEMDAAAGTMVIEGYLYRFAPEIPVQTGGMISAAPLVEPGMQVQLRYLHMPDGSRELLELRQIPPGVEIERH